MPRPRYETEADRERQRAVARQIGIAWACELVEAPRLSPYDYEAWRDGQLVALVEIKCRTKTYAELEPVKLSARKWAQLVVCAERQPPGVDSWLVFGFGDGEIRYVDASLMSSSLMTGGRRDRGDPRDLELMCTVPLANTLRLRYR